MDIIPVILVVVCTEGYQCKPREYPMPNWEVCLQSAEQGSRMPFSVPAVKQEFLVSAVCVGREK